MSVAPHKFYYNSALELPKTAVVTGNAVLLQHILDDLKFRIRETEQLKEGASAVPAVPDAQIALLKAEVDDLKGKLANHTPRKEAVPAVADPKIAELQRQVDDLTARIARTWANGGSPAAPAPSVAAVQATDEVARLKRTIQQQRLQIHNLESHHSNNTLNDLLLKLKHVLKLQLDNEDQLYTEVAEAIYENTSKDVRDTMFSVFSTGEQWKAYVAHILKDQDAWDEYLADQHTGEEDSSDIKEEIIQSDIDTEEDSETDGLPDTGNNRQKTPRLESAKANRWNQAKSGASGMMARAKRGFGFGNKSTADLSSLLSDLKRVSDAGTTCSVDADVPPT